VTGWSRGAERLYGWRPEEAVGRHADELFSPGCATARRSCRWRTSSSCCASPAARRQREQDERRAIESLTRREREVPQALADGLDSREMAERLHITVRTQRNRVANILALDVHSQLQALFFALRYDAVSVERSGGARRS
jgi:DNA-binding NarL/FixJ family response regulator